MYMCVNFVLVGSVSKYVCMYIVFVYLYPRVAINQQRYSMLFPVKHIHTHTQPYTYVYTFQWFTYSQADFHSFLSCYEKTRRMFPTKLLSHFIPHFAASQIHAKVSNILKCRAVFFDFSVL